SEQARSMFTTEISIPVLALPELYAGKTVAALDPQHPRDFFDMQHMVSVHGLPSTVVDCFVCYLAGHNRPIHEVLFSRDHDLRRPFENEFLGMTRVETSVEAL